MDYRKLPGMRHRGWLIFVVGTFGFSVSNFYRVSLPVISVDLVRDLSLTTTQLSHLSASFFYAFAVIQIPAGLIMDRFGVRRVVMALGVLGIPGTLMFALAGTFEQALWGRILMGIGMSCNLMGLLVLLARWFPAYRFATLMGLAVAIGTAGSLLAATPLVMLNRALGWRGSFLLLSLVNLSYVITYLAVIRDRPSETSKFSPGEGRSLKDLVKVFTFPYYWIISLASFFRYGCFTALQGLWAGPYLIKGLGLSTLQTGNALFLMGAGYMTGLPLFGRISDHRVHSRKWVVQPSLFLLAFLFLLLVFWPKNGSLTGLYIIFFSLGLLAAPGQIMYPHIKELVPPEVMGTATTGINLFTMLGPAFIMQAMGLVVAGGPLALYSPEAFRPAWLLCAAGLVLSGLLYLLVPESGLFKGRGSREKPSS